MKVFIAAVSILLTFTVHYGNANPSKVGCNLIGSSNGLNVMEQNMIMGQTPIEATDLIRLERQHATSLDIVYTLSLRNLEAGGVVLQSSYGKFRNVPNTLTDKGCVTNALYYQQSGVPSNFEVELVLPRNVTKPSTYVSAITAKGFGQVKRQRLQVYFDNNDPDPVAAPTPSPEIMQKKTASFNPNERQFSVEWRVKNYTLPKQQTTYVDFVFNFNDESHDIFHIVFGEALVDIEWGLHHFVVTGCSQKIDPGQEGLPLSEPPSYCNIPVGGFAGWAPGATLWDMPISAGVPFGKGAGIVAVSINVHYTDADKFPTTVANDGIKVYYTPDLRPNTVHSTSPMNIGTGPDDMSIPAKTKRAYITKRCKVKDRCEDSSPNFAMQHLQQTCEDIKTKLSLCQHYHVRSYCPETCGLCHIKTPKKVVGIFFHAHLLGREMYAKIKKHNDGRVLDVESQTNWIYDNQRVFNIPVERNITIESGDEIQVSCVYDSSERDSKTKLGLSTYDEMCIHSFQTIHATPNISYAPFGTFRCEGNITTGAMEEHENGFDIGTGIHQEAFKTDIWKSNLDNSVDSKVDVSNEKQIIRYYADDNSCTLLNGIPMYDSEKDIGLAVLYQKHVLDAKTEAVVVISEGKNNSYMSQWPPVLYQIREWDCDGDTPAVKFKHCQDQFFQQCEPTFSGTFSFSSKASDILRKDKCQSISDMGNFEVVFGNGYNMCQSTPPPLTQGAGIFEFELQDAECPDTAPSHYRENANSINSLYKYEGTTADGRPYYKDESNGKYIYYDKLCSKSFFMTPSWLVTSVKPSLEVTENLQYGPGGGRGPDTPEAHLTDCNVDALFSSSSLNVPLGQKADFLFCGTGVSYTSTPHVKVKHASLILTLKSSLYGMEMYMALGQAYSHDTGAGFQLSLTANRDDAIVFHYVDNKLLVAKDETYALDVNGNRPPTDIGNTLNIFNCGFRCDAVDAGKQNRFELFGTILSPEGHSSRTFTYNSLLGNFEVINGTTAHSLHATWVPRPTSCCQALTKECLACKNQQTVEVFCEKNVGKYGCLVPSDCIDGVCCGLGTVFVDGKCLPSYNALENICESNTNPHFDCHIVASPSDSASCN